MPFTFAHPAIVLPFGLVRKKWFSLTGLIVGSMSPDFEYFFRMQIRSDISHTITGLFLFDLPASLLIALVFHQFIKPVLLPNLPRFLASRFLPFTKFNWLNYLKSNFPVVIISILIGAASHISWDGFTHPGGYFVMHISVLPKILFYNLPLYKILQHSSTVLGLLTIILVILSLPKTTLNMPSNSDKSAFWLITLAVSAVVISIYIFLQNGVPVIGNLIVAYISSAFIGIITASVFKIRDFNLRPGKNQRL